jgi:hypothetical protein
MIENIKILLKDKNINDTSINKYTRDLILLNDKKEITDLKFLNNKEKINNYIENNEKYKPQTKRNYYNSINSTLLLFPKLKKIQSYYYEKFNHYNNIIKNNGGKLSEEKKDKYIEYNELHNIYNDLKNKVYEFNNKDKLDKKEYNLLL